jgi:hypothetical protein
LVANIAIVAYLIWHVRTKGKAQGDAKPKAT